jgi:hypothetical protein
MDITETREEKDIQIELIASYLEGLYNANDARRIRELLSDRDGWRETARQSQGPVEFLQGEYDKLLKIIEDAPHSVWCATHDGGKCNCFKSKVTE